MSPWIPTSLLKLWRARRENFPVRVRPRPTAWLVAALLLVLFLILYLEKISSG